MKTPLSFYLVAAAAGTFACSSDGGTPRDMTAAGGSAGQSQVGNAGSSAGGSSGSGSQSNAGSGGGGGASAGNVGPALTITTDGTDVATATVADLTGNSGINGAALTVKSPMGTTLNPAFQNGALCMNGTTSIVPNSDYTNYWGGLISLDLNRVANPEAGGADAGADAGDAGAAVLGMVPQPWNPTPGKVIGFSFKIDGPTMPLSLRFQGTPTGSDPSLDHFCATVAAVKGATINVKFTEIVRNCYDATPGASLFLDSRGYTQLQNVNWQVSSSDMVPIPFDFCISEIKPILGD